MHSLILSLLLSQAPAAPTFAPEELPARFQSFSSQEKRRFLPLWASHGPGQAEKRYSALLDLLDQPGLKESDAALIAFVATRIQTPEFAKKLPGRAQTPEQRRRYAPLFAAAPGPESFAALAELAVAKPDDEELKTHLAAALTRDCLDQVEKLLQSQPELAAPLARQLLGLDARDLSDAAALSLRLVAMKSRQPQNPEAFPKDLVSKLVAVYQKASKLPPEMVIQAPPEELLAAEFPPLLHRRVAPLVAFPKDGTLRDLNLALSLGLSAEAFCQHHELLPRLFAADAKTRVAAFNSLTDKPALLLLPALIILISDRDTNTRIAALDAIDAMTESSATQVLAEFPPAKAAPILTSALTDDDSGVVISSLHLAMSLQMKDLSPLIASLCDSRDTHVLDAAIQALAKLEGENAQDALLPLLTHRDWSIRSRATKAIASFSDPQISPDKILELFGKESEALIRYDLIGILGKIKSEESTAILRQMSKDAKIPGNLRAAAVCGLINSEEATVIDLKEASAELATATDEVRYTWLKAAVKMELFEVKDLDLFLSEKTSNESLVRFLNAASEIKIPGLAERLKAEMGSAISGTDELGKIFTLYGLADELQFGLVLNYLNPTLKTPKPELVRLHRLLSFPPLPGGETKKRLKAASSANEESIEDDFRSPGGFGNSSSQFKLSPANNDKLATQLRKLSASWDLPSQAAAKMLVGDAVSKEDWQVLFKLPDLRKPDMSSTFQTLLNKAPQEILKPYADEIFASIDKTSFEMRYNLERQLWLKQVSPAVMLKFLESSPISASSLGSFATTLKLKPDQIIRIFVLQQELNRKVESYGSDFFESAAQALTGNGRSFSSGSSVVPKEKQLKLTLADLQGLAQLEGTIQSYYLQSFIQHLSPETQSLIAEKVLSKEITGPGVPTLLSCVKLKASPEIFKFVLAAADQGQFIPFAKSPESLKFWQDELEKTATIDATALCRALCYLSHNQGEDEGRSFSRNSSSAAAAKPLLPPKFRQMLLDQALKTPPELLAGALAVIEQDQPPKGLQMRLLTRLYTLPLHPHVLGSSVRAEAQPLEKMLKFENGRSRSYFGSGYGRDRGVEKPGMAPDLFKSPVRLALRDKLLAAFKASPESVLNSTRFSAVVQEFFSRNEVLQNFLLIPSKGENDYSSYILSSLIEAAPGGSLTAAEITPLFQKLKTTKISPRILAAFGQILTPDEIKALRPAYAAEPKNAALRSLMAKHIGPDEAPLAAEFLLAAAPDYFLNPDPRMGRSYSSSDEEKPGRAFLAKLTDKSYRESFLPALKPILSATPNLSPTQLGLMLCLGIKPSANQIDAALTQALKTDSSELDKNLSLNLAYACGRVTPDCLRLHLLVIKGAGSAKADSPKVEIPSINLPPGIPEETRQQILAQLAASTPAGKPADSSAVRLAALSLSTSTHWFTPLVITGERWNFQAGNQPDKRPSALEQFQMAIDFKGPGTMPMPPLTEAESAALVPLRESLRSARQELIGKAEKDPSLFMQLAASSDIFPDSAVLDFYTKKPELASDPLALKAATRILASCPEGDTLKLLGQFRALPKLSSPLKKFSPVLASLSEAKLKLVATWLISEAPEARSFLKELRGSDDKAFQFSPSNLTLAIVKAALRDPAPSPELLSLLTPMQKNLLNGLVSRSLSAALSAALAVEPATTWTPWLKHLKDKSLIPDEAADSLLLLEPDLAKRRAMANEILRFNAFATQSLKIRTEELLSSPASEALLLADIPFHQGHPTYGIYYRQSLKARREQLEQMKQYYPPEEFKKQEEAVELSAALYAARLKVFKQLQNPSPQCLYTLTLASQEEFTSLAEPFFQRQAWPEWPSPLVLLLPEDKALPYLQQLLKSRGEIMAASGEIKYLINMARDERNPLLAKVKDELEKLAPKALNAHFLSSSKDKWKEPSFKEETPQQLAAPEGEDQSDAPDTPEEETEFDK